MTTPFYAPAAHFAHGRVQLPPDEARHAVKVLRHRVGDEIDVVDGVGGWHRVRLVSVAREGVIGEVIETKHEAAPARRIVLALGVLHHRDRFEWAVEKAVELGVTAILPLRTQRVAPGRIRHDRLEHIAVAAMKQSLRSTLPVVHEEASLAEALRFAPDARLLLAHEAAPAAPTPSEAVGTAGAIVMFVGPEGGFTEAEVAGAAAAGATVVTLGPHRLRAETAALVALSDLLLGRRPG